MAFTGLQLVDPVSGASSVLMPRDGVTVLSLDVQPSVRAVAEERVGGSGQVDTTVNVSAAAVTASFRLWQGSGGLTPEQFMDEIGRLLSPALRPNLIATNDQWPQQRQLAVRFDSKTNPVDNPMTTDMAVSWKVPAGVWQAAQIAEIIAPAFITALGGLPVSSTGLAVATTGLGITAATLTGSPVVVSGGNMPVPWKAKLYGPCSGPRLANDSAGLTLEFKSSLSLGPGAYIALDSAAHTAFLNSDPTQSVLGQLSFDTSAWWLMQPGSNSLRYYPVSASGGSIAVVDFQPAWLP